MSNQKLKSQIFKKHIPLTIFFTFLNSIYFEKKKSTITINKTSFKKAQLNNCLSEFLNTIEPYYYKSKQYYVQRKLDFYKFMTIIRQICKHNEIPIRSKIKYDKSSYEFNYFIDYPLFNLNDPSMNIIINS